MAKRNNRTTNRPAVKAGAFPNYTQWWLSGGDISSLIGATTMYSDSAQGRIQAATYNVWAANCIAARSETLASVDLKLYEKSDDPEEEDKEITDHPILELLDNVNPINLKKTSFREQTERQLSIHGECYIHKVRDSGGVPSEMYILPAQYVEALPDAQKLVSGYRYQTSIVLRPEDVIRIYYPSDDNPILARSPLTSAIGAINNYNLSDLAQQGIDRRGGQGGGIVMVDFNAIQNDPQRFMQEWDAKRSDPRNAGRDAFLPADSSYESGTLTAQQQQREERAIRLIREIMAAFRVPPSLAGDYKDASVLANAAQQSRNFWETFLLFELKRLEDALNYGLLWQDYKGSQEKGLYLKHDISEVAALSDGMDAEVTRENMKATTADLAFSAGIISLNEARIDIGKDPLDDPRADEVLQPEMGAVDENGMPLPDAQGAQGGDLGAPADVSPDPAVEGLLEEAGSVKAEPVKAVDKDGDGYVYDNTPQQRRATKEEMAGGKKMSKGDAMLAAKDRATAAKQKKKKGKGGGKKKVAKTEEQKVAEKDAKHQAKVAAQVAQIDDYTSKLQAELERLTAKGDSFKDESNLRKRLGQKIKQLQAKKKRLQDSKSPAADSGAEDMLSEAASKAFGGGLVFAESPKAFSWCNECVALKACKHPTQGKDGRFTGCEKGSGSGTAAMPDDADYHDRSTAEPEDKEFIDETFESMTPKFTSWNIEGEETLKEYTHDGYEIINRNLRKSKGDIEDIGSPYAVKHIEQMDKMMKGSPISVIAHRAGVFNPELGVGSEFVDHAYVSTSLSKSVANSHATNGTPEKPRAMFKIYTPSGTKSIYPGEHSEKAGEYELILNRGLKYRVLKVDDNGNNNYDVALEVLSE